MTAFVPSPPLAQDATGLLRYLAFQVSRKGGSSGKKLYLSFYVFFLIFGMVSERDTTQSELSPFR
jgi:hypothetical protein